MKLQEEIKQLAETEYGTEIGSIRGSNPYDLEADRKNGFIKGYNQCQEDMADKKYTEEDVINIVNKSRETGLTAEYLMLSLNKQD